jgi:transposase
MIPRELEVKILHLHFAEHWPIGTIAAQLGVHHEVVERVVEAAEHPQPREVRPTLVDGFLPFILETWTKWPKLPASRLWRMCRERGYTGAKDHFRHLVRPYRQKPPAEAFLRLKTLPGEQAQIDWAHFGKVAIGRAQRFLVAFVAVLSWCRAIVLRFFLGQQMENFLRGHEWAFSRWGGCPKVLLYDNLKSAVLERVGDAIRFNRTLLDFAAHYRFEPRPVAVYRGNEKGRVERAIRYVRSGFFMGRPYRSVDDLNEQAARWCEGEAMDRRSTEDTRLTVREAFEQERARLMPLPENPFPTDERREVPVGKTPYVRFDLNDYSVPHDRVRRTLTVVASLDTVRVLDGTDEVARHARTFDKGRQVEDEAHIAALVEMKRNAREHRGLDRLAHAAPKTRTLLERLAERGKNLGYATRRLLALLDAHGAEALEAAVREVLARDVPHVYGVEQVLERERRARGLPPALAITLPDDPRVRDLDVRPHPLESYDAITTRHPEKEDHDHARQHDDDDDHGDAALPARIG